MLAEAPALGRFAYGCAVQCIERGAHADAISWVAQVGDTRSFTRALLFLTHFTHTHTPPPPPPLFPYLPPARA